MSWEVFSLATKAISFVPAVRGWWRDRWGRPLHIEQRATVPANVATLGTWACLTDDDCKSLPSDHVPRPSWFRDHHHAFPVGERRDDLRLTSRSKRTIGIDCIEPVIEQRRRGNLGAIIKWPAAGAYAVTFLGLDLSEGSLKAPVIVRRDGATEWTTKPYFPDHDLSFAPGETLSIAILSKTNADTVRWRLKITVSVGGRRRTLTYPTSKKPAYVTSGRREAQQYWMTGVAGLEGHPWLREVQRSEIFPRV